MKDLDIKMTKCFWCGEDTGIIMDIIKKQKKEKQNKSIVLNYDPCDKCQKNMDLGFTVIEVSYKPEVKNQPEIQEGIYPTSRYWVIKESVAIKIFDKNIKNKNKAFVTEDVAKEIGLYKKGE